MKLEDLKAKKKKRKKVPYVTELIEPGGPLSDMLDGYRPRPGQVAFAEAVEGAIRDGRHLLSEAPTGCHAKGQLVLTYEGDLKKVEDVVVGDLLMGPDSSPRRVLGLCRGREQMVNIVPNKGWPWVVNRSHILSLVRTSTSSRSERVRKDCRDGEVVDVQVRDWEEWSSTQKHIHKLFRVGVDFPHKDLPQVRVTPYQLGVFLGDGSTANGSPSVTNSDPEVVGEILKLAESYGLGIREDPHDNTVTHYLREDERSGSKRNPLNTDLRFLKLFKKGAEEKFIPQAYLVASRRDRLSLLAGLVDTDGNLSCGGYEVTSASERMRDGVLFLARSLGFAAYASPKWVDDVLYHRVFISGDVAEIPCKVKRKQAGPRLQKKSHLRTGFGTVPLEEGDYYGFTLDGDGRYLLGDFTVTHNTGKSFAYGLPAALHAVVENETVVVATANITLQEQLIDKDLPVIARVVELATGRELDYRLVKGMGNYLCLDNLEECLRVGADDWIDELVDWANKTETGDKSELEKEYPARIWGRVSTTSEDCLRDKCKFRDDCFVFKARAAGEAPHIVVTNYHMLFTDLAVREATAGKAKVLPDYGVLVMDEAHEAKDIAMAFQGYEWHIGRVRWLANRLRGTKIDGASKRADRLLAISSNFFAHLAAYEDPAERDTIIRKPLGWDESLVSNLHNTSTFLRNYALSQNPRSDDEKALVARIQKLGEVFLKRASEVDSVCTGVGDGQLPYGMVYYTEKKPPGDVSLCCKGVEVQEFLREQLFEQKVVICTSATLTTNNNFQFVADELGLYDEEYSAIISPEVFDSRRMLVVIPEDMPSPKDRDLHMNATAQVVDYLKEELGGRIMALFTSYKAMAHTAKFLSKYHDSKNIFLQGEMPKSRIISMFKKSPDAIILATASFWQGVDIPGQALSCLVIDKFPFLPPTDPVLKYMGGKPGADGMAAFFDYSVPKAVIAMKQGIGRLIRNETDYGVVVLCDNRLITKGYGSQFEKALPFGHYRSNKLSDAKDFLKEMANA